MYIITKDSKDIEFMAVKSENELKELLLVKKENDVLKKVLTLPISFLFNGSFTGSSLESTQLNSMSGFDSLESNTANATKVTDSITSQNNQTDYLTTNIQVENVDEADVVKTDGEYIYSISESNVVISKTDKEGKVEIISTIRDTAIPQDILINKNKLVVISYVSYNGGNNSFESFSPSRYYDSNNTKVEIYDITNKALPKSIKKINLDKGYYTSRMINDKIYVLTTGYINKYNDSDDEIIPYYTIDGTKTKFDLGKIRYIKDEVSNKFSTIATIDLSNLNTGVDISGYLMGIDNAYISEKNLYIAFEKYEFANINNTKEEIFQLFTLKGIPGYLKELLYGNNNGYNYNNYYTTIVKFKFTDTGIEYVANAKEIGKTLNQFSMDEYNGNLRVSLTENSNSNKVVVYSSDMKKTGSLENIAPGEKIYSTRFIKDRAYLVTYKTMDPLFVIDMSNVSSPKILGELKIPGYSTYLHPYDENHIIGIGNETKEVIKRDDFGKVISQRAYITGMKMAVFDVTDVRNPKEMFVQKIGDSYTYSSILKNHKALLFSKEKQLIAIPINNYKEEISLTKTDNIQTIINNTDRITQKSLANGYIVYNINLTDGFKQKGIITHNTTDKYGKYWYSGSNDVRGIYINDILYTISEKYIKAHSLDKLEEKSSLEIGR
jgi:uncharacterized secreted protein with C-terminal beta-propeller domain